MTQIFVHPDATVVGLYQSLLAEAGIPCFVRDTENLDPFATISLPSHLPSLCVERDEDAPRAVEVIREYQRGVAANASAEAPDWVCPACGEGVPASFSSCWKCQAGRAAV